jgi:hypothetical protein
MYKTPQQLLKAGEYESELIDLFNDDIPQTDLQGALSVIVWKIAHDKVLQES